MLPVTEAIEIINREVRPLKAEIIELEEANGRVLAENINADMDLPPFDRSQMDGFACRAADIKNPPELLEIIGESVAGRGFDGKVSAKQAVRIMTGARVPPGADAVQKVELTRENNGFVEILETVNVGQNINKCGSEIKKGTKVFAKGEIINERMVASLASFGYARIKVFRQPKVRIFSTGNEIVDVSETPQKDQIRNSNSVMLRFLVEEAGGKPEILPKVRDDFENLKKKIAEAVGIGEDVPVEKFRIEESVPQTKKTEILVITGGVSVGDYDFTKPALRELGAEIFFEKVSLKPGKPTVFARLNDVLIFGLPGNPVSVAVTFQLFVRQAILKMQSAINCGLKRGYAVASGKIKGTKERDCYLPVSLNTNRKGQLVIESLRFTGSSNFIAYARADALVFVPKGSVLEKNEVAEILFL